MGASLRPGRFPERGFTREHPTGYRASITPSNARRFLLSFVPEETMDEVVQRTGVPYLDVPEPSNRVHGFPLRRHVDDKCNAVFIGDDFPHK